MGLEAKTNSVKDWVESKLSVPPPVSSSLDADPSTIDPQFVGVPKVGDEILNGKYKIERVIGIGGMGVVMSAVHAKLGQQVAIKFLSSTMQTPELVDRFIREGQAAVRIKSEHIAPVLDVGVLDSGTPYLMMEYLSGADLSEYLIERGSVPIDEAVDFVLQACDALAVAHSAGIVHRDLKPSNLFITQRSDGSPLIKVLDFGISKISQRGTGNQPDPKTTLTRPGMMLGSPRYMSPEQLRNASSVDHRADIWAMGVVLHEIVAGTPPYDADTFAALCAMIASDPPIALRAAKPDAPEELEKIILKCIEKNPADRYQNVAELANALAPLANEDVRYIAHRVSKILGHIPHKTPPGSYPQNKISGANPKAITPSSSPGGHDKTLPLPTPASGNPTPLVPAATSNAPSATAPTTPAPAFPSASPLSTSEANVSALAVSNAKASPASNQRAKIGGAVALLALIGVIAATIIVMRKQPHPTTSTATSATTSTAAETATATTAEQPPPTAATTLPPPTTPTDIPTKDDPLPIATPPNAPAATFVPFTPQTGLGKPMRPKASASASAPPPPPASAAPSVTAVPVQPQQPSEVDMLNRRR